VPREGAAAPGAQAVKLQVTGMHCSACSSAVERALGALPGVRSAAVSLTMQQADVVRAPGGASEVRASAGAAAQAYDQAGGCSVVLNLTFTPLCDKAPVYSQRRWAALCGSVALVQPAWARAPLRAASDARAWGRGPASGL
jgi:copper chaperone CopZ